MSVSGIWLEWQYSCSPHPEGEETVVTPNTFKILWTKFMEFVIVHIFRFCVCFTKTMFHKFPIIIVLFSLVIFSIGCRSNSTKPSNPFAQNLKTVPPPATFSSQESYLGQTPGSYIPQTPATTFPPSGSGTSIQPAVTPATVPVSDVTNSSERATVFAASKESDWTPVVAATSQTAFQAIDAKVNSATSIGGISSDTSESLVVGTSYAVTTITDELQPETSLTEPALLLYSGN